VAVKVIEEPAQVGLLPVVIAIDTDGTNTGFTVIVTVLDVAGLPVAHVALEVNTQVTRSPLFRAAFV
jgi:hypothetical protein